MSLQTFAYRFPTCKQTDDLEIDVAYAVDEVYDYMAQVRFQPNGGYWVRLAKEKKDKRDRIEFAGTAQGENLLEAIKVIVKQEGKELEETVRKNEAALQKKIAEGERILRRMAIKGNTGGRLKVITKYECWFTFINYVAEEVEKICQWNLIPAGGGFRVLRIKNLAGGARPQNNIKWITKEKGMCLSTAREATEMAHHAIREVLEGKKRDIRYRNGVLQAIAKFMEEKTNWHRRLEAVAEGLNLAAEQDKNTKPRRAGAWCWYYISGNCIYLYKGLVPKLGTSVEVLDVRRIYPRENQNDSEATNNKTHFTVWDLDCAPRSIWKAIRSLKKDIAEIERRRKEKSARVLRMIGEVKKVRVTEIQGAMYEVGCVPLLGWFIKRMVMNPRTGNWRVDEKWEGGCYESNNHKEPRKWVHNMEEAKRRVLTALIIERAECMAQRRLNEWRQKELAAFKKRAAKTKWPRSGDKAPAQK